MSRAEQCPQCKQATLVLLTGAKYKNCSLCGWLNHEETHPKPKIADKKVGRDISLQETGATSLAIILGLAIGLLPPYFFRFVTQAIYGETTNQPSMIRFISALLFVLVPTAGMVMGKHLVMAWFSQQRRELYEDENRRESLDLNREESDPWLVLGLARDASIEEIKNAYQNKKKDFHLDKANHMNEEAIKSYKKKINDINFAYIQLKSRLNFS